LVSAGVRGVIGFRMPSAPYLSEPTIEDGTVIRPDRPSAFGDETAPSSGVALGRYVLYGEIASGGMASIHYGRLTGRGGFRREVAIKRLHRHLANDPEFVAMFLDEARLAARVVSPNVVPMLDVVARQDETFLVMDYVPGVALSQLVRATLTRDERVPVGVAVAIAIGALRGLHAAHEAKDDAGERLEIVHRDVSPQNVLVGQDGVPRLIDFGVAKAVVRLQTTREGHVKGKTAYMAPEQVIGALVTRRTDIFAATVVLWEMLTGRRRYAGDTDANILFRIVTAHPRPPGDVVTGIPPELDAIVLRGMARDAGDRYPTAQEMADELARLDGVATTEEVAAWVRRIAGAQLDERAARIAAFERAATIPDVEPPMSVSGTRVIPPPSEPPRDDPRDRATVPAFEGYRAVAPAFDPSTQTVALAPVRPRERGAERRIHPLTLAMGALLIAAVAATAGWALGGHTHVPAWEVRAPSAARPPELTSAPALAPAGTIEARVIEAPRVIEVPKAEAPKAEAPKAEALKVIEAPKAEAPALPSLPPSPALPPISGEAREKGPNPVTAPSATTVPPPRAPRRSRPAGRATTECTPYTVDAKGHTHFNPACL
jgi:serine/threonine-protein kinase